MLLRRGVEDATRQLRPRLRRGARVRGPAAPSGSSTRLEGSSSMNAPTTEGSNCLP